MNARHVENAKRMLFSLSVIRKVGRVEEEVTLLMDEFIDKLDAVGSLRPEEMACLRRAYRKAVH